MIADSREQFTAFYQAEQARCLQAVYAVVGDRYLAEELTAEAFATAWARWPAVRRHERPRAWVIRSALNLNISWWRRRRHDVPLGDHEPPAALAAEPGRPEIVALLRALPERQRQVFALRVFLDLDTRMTADTLGIATGTVTAHLHRATNALRIALQASLEEETSA